jgi:hypothetical protein
MEYFNCLGTVITNDARCMHEIKFRITMAKAAFNKKKTNLYSKHPVVIICKYKDDLLFLHFKTPFISKLDLKLKKKLVKSYIWSIALYGAETWTLGKVDQKYLECFEMWCRRRMEKINWTNRVKNEEVLRT